MTDPKPDPDDDLEYVESEDGGFEMHGDEPQ